MQLATQMTSGNVLVRVHSRGRTGGSNKAAAKHRTRARAGTNSLRIRATTSRMIASYALRNPSLLPSFEPLSPYPANCRDKSTLTKGLFRTSFPKPNATSFEHEPQSGRVRRITPFPLEVKPGVSTGSGPSIAWRRRLPSTVGSRKQNKEARGKGVSWKQIRRNRIRAPGSIPSRLSRRCRPRRRRHGDGRGL